MNASKQTRRALAWLPIGCALLLTAACATQPLATKTDIRYIPTPVKQPVPAALLLHTPVPQPPEPAPMSDQQHLDYTKDVLNALGTCNADKDRVKELVVVEGATTPTPP